MISAVVKTCTLHTLNAQIEIEKKDKLSLLLTKCTCKDKKNRIQKRNIFKTNFHNQIRRGAQKKEKENSSSRSNSHLQHNICCSIKVFWLYYNSVGNSVAGILDFVAAKGSFIYYVTTTFSRNFWAFFFLLYVLKISNYCIKISPKSNVETEILLFWRKKKFFVTN